ncbi:GDSL-type esterase/lipase family protein [Actinokineospora spheciospongiae]|uniref:GDSL-type esterase/lipase family protein n=1 Tax=Actinokineospora spheciospongiae TaxID=909613 RepID=UPI000D70A058|nr:GDSL-type esterase/lipase family protein [Actinokineospora spheciospongiae]PWW56992.1 GDSL-like lipase/acylhydrolase family protein [Actinokineospora spheciospongiae]
MLPARTLGTAVAAVLAAALAVPALTTPARADDRPTAVVSLGDSAISGEGAGDYEAGTDGEGGNWCHRSPHALIHQTRLADKAVNLACSGANASNVSLADTTHNTEGSQARRLIQVATENRVTAVVLQVGANDDPDFTDTIIDCVLKWFNPFGSDCSAALRDQWPGRLSAMAPRVEAAVADVKSAMRQAGYADTDYRFVLTSYSSPLTEKMDPATHGPEGCPLRIADAKWGRTEAVPQMAEALRGVATRAGVSFLDLSRATEGREACSGSRDSEWQNRLMVDPEALVTGGLDAIGVHMAQQSFHPNARGHAQLGRCVAEFVTSGADAAACVIGGDGNLHSVA